MRVEDAMCTSPSIHTPVSFPTLLDGIYEAIFSLTVS